jgi:hypothetical protein
MNVTPADRLERQKPLPEQSSSSLKGAGILPSYEEPDEYVQGFEEFLSSR